MPAVYVFNNIKHDGRRFNKSCRDRFGAPWPRIKLAGDAQGRRGIFRHGATSAATRIIESRFAGDMDDFMRQFQKNIIAEADNANYYTGANLTKDSGSNVRNQDDVRDGVLIADDALAVNRQLIIQKMLTSVENNVLAPNYIYNYIVLDSMYSDFPVYPLPWVGFDQVPPYTYFVNTNLQSVYSWQLT